MTAAQRVLDALDSRSGLGDVWVSLHASPGRYSLIAPTVHGQLEYLGQVNKATVKPVEGAP